MARKILLADDSVTAQNMGRKILADAGYEVITVNNGSAALKKIAELKPDIIILDVYMPGYSGLEVCQRLKEAQETSRIPVLLTVGKLEPFKPEEAKRVRAEGYIVKPFEASELLSTLSKLEDKIVPRAEPSKPGRFARANAAIDEGRYDKSMTTEEDSGWKNRIGFPSKTKKAAQESEGDDSTIYNAVNKDLRTVIDRKQAQDAKADAKAEEARVDLGALAAEGLPKDVTPEEIAALAAAAAQVKGKLGENAFVEAQPEPAAVMEAKAVEAPPAEEKIEAKLAPEPLADAPKESALVATFAPEKTQEQAEARAEKREASFAADVPSPTEMMAAIAGLVPEVGQAADASSGNGSGSHGAQAHTGQSHTAEHHIAERPADEPVTMAAAAGARFGSVASRWTAVAVALAPDEAAISLEHEMQKAHAAFAAADAADARPAAPMAEVQHVVVESPASAQISSTVEQQQATHAIPAPEVQHEVKQVEVRPAEASLAETPQTEVRQPEVPHADVAHSIGAVASSAADALAGAVREFERVVASHVHPQPAVEPPAAEPARPEETKAAAMEVTEPMAPAAPEMPVVEAKAETKFEDGLVASAAAPEPEPESAKSEIANAAAEPTPADWKHEDQKHGDRTHEDRAREEGKHEDARPTEWEEPAPGAPFAATTTEEKSDIDGRTTETSTPAVVHEEIANQSTESRFVSSESSPSESSASSAAGYKSFASETSSSPDSVDQISAGPSASDRAQPEGTPQPAAENGRDASKKESDIAETTAAAWASWRRIRESGDSKGSHSAKPKAEAETKPVPPDAAAMAVAAGAEKSPEEGAAAPQESGEIASIVDSMLADMRPRIVEEVSRKLGKKK